MRLHFSDLWADTDVRGKMIAAFVALYASLVLVMEVLTLTPSRGFDLPAWDADTPSEVCTALIVLVGLCFAASQLWRCRRNPPLRLGWAFASVGMALIATSETADWFNETGPFWNEAFWFEVPLWLVAAACLHQCTRLHGSEPRVRAWFRFGMAAQSAFAIFDIAQGTLGTPDSAWAGVLEVATDYAGMLCVTAYVSALVMTRVGQAVGRIALQVAGAAIGALAGPCPDGARLVPPVAIGTLARTLFFDLHMFRAARYPTRYPILHRQGFRQAVTLGMAILFGGLVGPGVRRAGIMPLMRQMGDLFRIGIGQGFDAVSYYLFELYWPDRRAEARYYLTRYETKNGLFAVLNASRPGRSAVPRDLTDKAVFGRLCGDAGIPTPPILMTAVDGHVEWLAPPQAFDRDLFTKLMRGRGTMRTSLFRRVAPLRYADRQGQAVTIAGIAERLRRQSLAVVGRKTTPVILQPRLRNHESLADLARDSLIVVRIVTCLDRDDVPEVTHAMLRILTKIEPDWDTRPDTEYGVAVDIATGRLARLTGDTPVSCLSWHDVHPVTGAPVLGRQIADWPALRDLALATHRLFRHRIVIGWDVALTTEGPMMIEGNSNMDVSFIQRAYREPIGRSRLGELLAWHLSRL